MIVAKLTSKGQITLPRDVRRSLHLEAGDGVAFVEIAPGRFEVLAATGSVTALKGMFGLPEAPVSIEDMNLAIARAAAR